MAVICFDRFWMRCLIVFVRFGEMPGKIMTTINIKIEECVIPPTDTEVRMAKKKVRWNLPNASVKPLALAMGI